MSSSSPYDPPSAAPERPASTDSSHRPDDVSPSPSQVSVEQAHPQPYQGQPYPGQPYPGQPYAGHPHPGPPYAGQQPHPGQQPYLGHPYPGQPYAGQQPYPGQPIAGHPHLEPLYAGQPNAGPPLHPAYAPAPAVHAAAVGMPGTGPWRPPAPARPPRERRPVAVGGSRGLRAALVVLGCVLSVAGALTAFALLLSRSWTGDVFGPLSTGDVLVVVASVVLPVAFALAVLRGRARVVLTALGPALLTIALVTFMALVILGMVFEPIGEYMLFFLGGGGDYESFQNSRS